MIKKETLKFLKDLKKNNTRDWFEGHRGEYEDAKADYLALVEDMIKGIGVFDDEIKNVKAKDCMFRINRDVRFSKDKSPYKTHFGAYISARGRKSDYPGYYAHLEPGRIFSGGGCYVLMPDELHAIRQEIDYNPKDFLKVVEKASFKKMFGELEGEQLKTTPKGYEADNPNIKYLRYKSFFVSAPIDDKTATSKDCVPALLKQCKELYPLNNFLKVAFEK